MRKAKLEIKGFNDSIVAKVRKYYYKLAITKDTEITHNLKLLNPDMTVSGLTAGQAVKGARGMPWHQEPMKDVTSCDKLGVAANKL